MNSNDFPRVDESDNSKTVFEGERIRIVQVGEKFSMFLKETDESVFGNDYLSECERDDVVGKLSNPEKIYKDIGVYCDRLQVWPDLTDDQMTTMTDVRSLFIHAETRLTKCPPFVEELVTESDVSIDLSEASNLCEVTFDVANSISGPNVFKGCPLLKFVSLTDSKITWLPDTVDTLFLTGECDIRDLSHMCNLDTLFLSKITRPICIPDSVVHLDVSCMDLRQLNFSNLTHLKSFDIGDCCHVPSNIPNSVESLTVDIELSLDFSHLSNLRKLNVTVDRCKNPVEIVFPLTDDVKNGRSVILKWFNLFDNR